MSSLNTEHVDLVQVVEAAGVELKRSGSRHVGLCPFHGDRIPSFFVFENSRFKCFGCGEYGDSIDFVQKAHNCDFKEALRILGIERGPLTPKKREEIERFQHHRKLVKAFRRWEVDASNEIGMLCRCARKVLAKIRTEPDLLKYGEVYHKLETWQYQLDILTSGDDRAKFEMFRNLAHA
jgi:DNA primase